MGVLSRRSTGAAPAVDSGPAGGPDSVVGAGSSGSSGASGPASVVRPVSGRTFPGRFSLGRLGRRAGASEADSVVEVVEVQSATDSGLKPSAMRGPEALYGYVVGLELVVVSVLNLTVTHGPGAPAHPPTTLAAVGVAASIAFFAVVRLKNRMAAGFGAIVAAFFVTLPRVPNSMSIAHIFALVIPMAYGLIITQRQRRDTPKLARGAGRGGRGGSGKSSAGAAGTSSGAGAAGGRRRGKKNAEAVSGPRPSARYTPPKSKRKPSGR